MEHDQFERTHAAGKVERAADPDPIRRDRARPPTRADGAQEDGYTAQAFSQDGWMPLDSSMRPGTALNASIKRCGR